MNILYGVQTTGNGHLVRAKNIIPGLRQKGHHVHTLFSGDINKSIQDIDLFRPYTFKKGLTFRTRSGKLNYPGTLKELNFYRFYKDIISFDARGFDVVITDYEPITSRIAKYKKIPSIGVGHIHAFCHDVPIYKNRRSVALYVMNNFAPTDIPIGLHWHHFDQPILPPMIPQDIKEMDASTQKDKIVVYLNFEELEQVKRYLSGFPTKTFYIYSSIEEGYDQENLKIRPLDRENFIQDLGEAEGVVCNSGFSLLSEALHLGKKILTKPVTGQIEQESNALALEKLELGTVMHDLDEESMKKWMDSPSPPPQNYPDVAEEFIRWVDQGQWDNTKELIQKLWNE